MSNKIDKIELTRLIFQQFHVVSVVSSGSIMDLKADFHGRYYVILSKSFDLFNFLKNKIRI